MTPEQLLDGVASVSSAIAATAHVLERVFAEADVPDSIDRLDLRPAHARIAFDSGTRLP